VRPIENEGFDHLDEDVDTYKKEYNPNRSCR
jgi:hypothetical protein